MTRVLSAFLILGALAACSDEPENIQTKADNLSRSLENKAQVLEAEAANSVDAAVAPLDNQASALLGAAGDAAADPGNAADNRMD